MFSFYNDQLFRVAVDYDRRKTEGLMPADLEQPRQAALRTLRIGFLEFLGHVGHRSHLSPTL